MPIRYDVLISPEFRRKFIRLDEPCQRRLDDWIYRLRCGEVMGAPHDEGWELETEAGEIIDYDYRRSTIILLNIKVVGFGDSE